MENTKKQLLRRAVQIAAFVLFVLALLACLAVLGFRAYWMLSVNSYYKASERAFEIPGLEDEFVPQGFCFDEGEGVFLISGYSSSDEPSHLFLVKRDSEEEPRKVFLQNEDGTPFMGHAGGVAKHGDFVYIAGGTHACLYVYSYGEIARSEQARCIGTFSLSVGEEDHIRTSSVYADGDRLVAVEFYMEPSYATLDSHKMATAGGDRHGALAVEFVFSDTAEFGIEPKPVKAYSIRDKVQGLCFDGGKLYLSTSYGLNFSHIYVYDEAKLQDEGAVTVLGTSVPLFSADHTALEAEYKIPPMSEEILVLDGELYVMSESASDKYVFGKFTGGRWCYRTVLSEVKTEVQPTYKTGAYREDAGVMVISKSSDIDKALLLLHYHNRGIVVVEHWSLADDVQQVLRGAVLTSFTAEDRAVVFWSGEDGEIRTKIIQGNADIETAIDAAIGEIRAK